MSVHRYPRRSLTADYLRAAAGLTLTAGPLAVVPAGAVAAPILGGLAVLFVVFGARTALRHASRIEMDDERLALLGPWPRRIAWDEVTGLRLRYFATRRGRGAGWMQLILTAPGVRLRLDSTLEDFPAIARRAARAACDRRGQVSAGAGGDPAAFVVGAPGGGGGSEGGG